MLPCIDTASPSDQPGEHVRVGVRKGQLAWAKLAFLWFAINIMTGIMGSLDILWTFSIKKSFKGEVSNV